MNFDNVQQLIVFVLNCQHLECVAEPRNPLLEQIDRIIANKDEVDGAWPINTIQETPYNK